MVYRIIKKSDTEYSPQVKCGILGKIGIWRGIWGNGLTLTNFGDSINLNFAIESIEKYHISHYSELLDKSKIKLLTY